MAELLSGIYGGNADRPGFFEVISQEQLRQGFLPAAQFLANFLITTFPQHVNILNKWEAVYLAGMVAAESYHLRHYSASVTEYFYSLQRQLKSRELTPLERVEHSRRGASGKLLTRRLRMMYLVILILVPYLDDKIRKWRTQDLERWQKRLLDLYSRISSFYSIAKLYYIVRYLADATNFWSPWDHLFGVVYRRVPAAAPLTEPTGWKGVLSKLSKYSLWTVIYGMQFLQWWYARESQLQPYVQKPLPDAPPPRPLTWRGKGRQTFLPQDQRICPLCHRLRTNPACAPSGYVFCYPCLVNYVRENRQCPITGISVPRVEDIRRLYEASE